MKSRRDFLMAGAAAVGTASIARVWAAKTSGTEFPFADFEQRIARKDFRGMTKDVLPTPCMVVDLDMFQFNVKHMADTAKTNGRENHWHRVSLRRIRTADRAQGLPRNDQGRLAYPLHGGRQDVLG